MFKIPVLIFSFLLVIGAAASQKEVDDMHTHIYTLMKAFPDSALALADKSLQLSQELDYEWGIGNSYFIKGFIAKKQNRLSQAFLDYLQAIDHLEPQDAKKAIEATSMILSNCGIILADYGQFHMALDFYSRSLSLSANNNLVEKSSWALYNRGSVYLDAENYLLAINDLEACGKLAVKQSNEFLFINSLNLLGLTYMNQQQYHKARDTFKKIIHHPFQSLAAAKYLGRAYHNTARTFFEQEDFLQAQRWFEKAVLAKEDRNIASELFVSYKALARTLAINKSIDEAFIVGKKAEQQYAHVTLTEDNLEIFKILREVSYTLGKYEEANEYSFRYEEETSKYLAEQQKIFEAKEQFTKELITAGFFQSKDTKSPLSFLNYLLLAIIVLGSGALLAYRYVWMRRKLAITEEIRAINIESNF